MATESKPWLARYVGDSLRNPWAAFVHTIGDLSVATTCWGILAVRDDGVQEWPPTMDAVLSNKGRKALSPFVRDPFKPILRTSLASLVLWCQAVHSDTCESCNGHGVEEGTAIPCSICDGSGCWIPGIERKAPSWLTDAVIDRNRLGWLLAPELFDLPDEPVLVGISTTTKAAVVLESPWWRVVLMQLEPKQFDGKGAPSFHPEPEFAVMWIERDDPDVRLILADWLEERDDSYADVLRAREETPCPTD